MSPRAAWRLEAAGFTSVYDYVAGKSDWLAAGVVTGAVHRDQLAAAAEGVSAGALMRFGVTTVRPSEQAADLVHRMGHAQITRIVVTRPDGTLVGLFFAQDFTPS